MSDLVGVIPLTDYEKSCYNKGRADAIDKVRNLITQKLQTECHFKYCDDSDDCCEVNVLMWLDEQLKEQNNG